MTRNEIILLVRDSLAFNTALDQGIILRHMDRFQSEYELGSGGKPLPWFIFDHDATVVTVSGNRYADRPDGFVQFDEDFELSILDSDSVAHPLYRRKQYELVGDSALSGFPTHYAFDGSRFHFYPIPDAVYTVNAPCYVRGAALSATENSDWYTEFPSLVAEETAFSIARSSRDAGFLKTSTVQMLRSDYLRRVEEMKHSLQQYVMGGHGA